MSVRLRPMTAEEFDAFRARAIAEYARAHVEAGEWGADEAQELAERDTDTLLPQGIDTPAMLLLVAEADERTLVGRAWLSLGQREKPGAWIFDIEIEPELRGRGYGRALLQALEQIVVEHGRDEIGLNVFAGNAVARRLYERAGYEPTSLHMRKPLS